MPEKKVKRREIEEAKRDPLVEVLNEAVAEWRKRARDAEGTSEYYRKLSESLKDEVERQAEEIKKLRRGLGYEGMDYEG